MTTPTTIIAPSILAADFGSLSTEIKEVSDGGADWIHIDVMDGRFVPPITFGANVVELAKKVTGCFLDVHLMIEKPEDQIEAFAKAGADGITIHQEVSPHLHRQLIRIRELGCKSGVAVNPGTPVESIYDVLPLCDLVLVMTVNPGWGGQKFIAGALPKLERLKSEIARQQLNVRIEVDGGITAETAVQCKKAGASVLVAGSSIFGEKDRAKAISNIRTAAQ